MLEWKFRQVIVENNWKHGDLPEGIWLPVGRIEIPCFYFLYGVNVRKTSIWKKIKVKEIECFKTHECLFCFSTPYWSDFFMVCCRWVYTRVVKSSSERGWLIRRWVCTGVYNKPIYIISVSYIGGMIYLYLIYLSLQYLGLAYRQVVKSVSKTGGLMCRWVILEFPIYLYMIYVILCRSLWCTYILNTRVYNI